MTVCTDPNALKLIVIILKVIDILKIAVLVVLIVMGMIGLAKAVIAGNPDEIKTSTRLFFKKLIAGSLVFLIPTIVETGLVFFGDLAGSENFTDCIENTNNISYYEWLEEERERQKQENNNNNSSSGSSSSSNDKNIFIGTKYSLTDEQAIRFLKLRQMAPDAYEKLCKGCDLCIKSCPGNALEDGFCAEKCISFLTQK